MKRHPDEIAAKMHEALRDKEFKLYLQPKIDLKTKSTAGAEALVRWIDKKGEILFPNEFIPVFEQNGFCIFLDDYMLEQTCQLIRQWMENGIEPIPISVNQSRLIFFQPDYTARLQQLMETYQIPRGILILEITEGIALEKEQHLTARLTQIQNLGIQISMDDFGTGYSSLTMLGSLPIDELKLDRGFLLKASDPADTRSRIILQHIFQLAKSLNLPTVAEGIETVEQETFVRNWGGSYGQGYLYDRPMPVKEFNTKYMRGNFNEKTDFII